MEKPQQTFPLYFKDIVDMLVPEDVPQKETLNGLLADFATTPLVELAQQASRLFDLLANLPGSTDIALHLGAHVPFTAYAPLAIPMKFAPTVGDAIEFLCRFIHLQAPLISPRYTPVDDGATITLTVSEPMNDKAMNFIVVAAFVALSSEIASTTHKKRNFQRMELRTASADILQKLETTLGVRPITGAADNNVLIDRQTLGTTNPFADPLTFKNYIKQFELMEREQQSNQSIAKQVKLKIAAHIEAPPSFGQLADQLRMTERQLRFALSKEDSNYRQLLQQARIEFAREQLASPRVSISGLAHQLGYTDVTAFNHGFKRWTGMSPTRYQKSIADDQADGTS